MPAKVKSPTKSRRKPRSRTGKNRNKPVQAPPSRPSASQAAVAVNQTKEVNSPGLKPADVLALQATMGNAAVQRLVQAQRSRGQHSNGANIGHSGKNGKTGITPVNGRSNGSALIQKAPAGPAMVVEKTHLRKPNSAGTAPKKLPALFNQVGKAIKSGDKIELENTTVPSTVPPNGSVKWQLAKHPKDPTKKGFVRMSKVLAQGGTTPTAAIDDPEKVGKNEQVQKLGAILGDLANDTTDVGGSIQDMLTASGKTEEELAAVLLANPKIAEKWTYTQNDVGSEEHAKEVVKKELPGWKNVLGKKGLLGFQIGGLATGLAGDTLGAFVGIVGFVDGLKKTFGTGASAGDKVEGVLATGEGLAGIGSALAGGVSKITGFVSDVVKSEGVSKGFAAVKEIFGFIGSGIDTVKGSVETVVKVVKAIIGGAKRRGRSAASTFRSLLETAADIAGSVLGTIKSAIETAAGVINLINSLPLVSSILGIVGSAIDVISGFIDIGKSIYDAIMLARKVKKQKELEKKLKSANYTKVETEMVPKLERMERATRLPGKVADPVPLEKDKKNKPTIKQQEATLTKFVAHSGVKTEPVKKDAKDVETHLMDQGLVATLRKRMKRAYSQVPEIIVDGVAALISVIGGMVSVGADIAALSGVGTPAALATKLVASTATSALTGTLKVGKALFKMGRVGVRKLKQFARDKGAPWTNPEKKSTEKLKKHKQETIRIMTMLSELKPFDATSEATKEPYLMAENRLRATGVDMIELFEKNGEPAEQAKMILEALKTR